MNPINLALIGSTGIIGRVHIDASPSSTTAGSPAFTPAPKNPSNARPASSEQPPIPPSTTPSPTGEGVEVDGR